MMPSIAVEGYWPRATTFHGREQARKPPARSSTRPVKATMSSCAPLGKATSAGPSRKQGSPAIKPQKAQHGHPATKLPSARRHWGCRVEVPPTSSRVLERRAYPAQDMRPKADGSAHPRGTRERAAHRHESRVDEKNLIFDMDQDLDVASLGSWSFSEDDALPEDLASEWAVLPPVPSPPMTPEMSRLSTPDLSPLATDFEFFPHWGYKKVEDKVGEGWYIAEKSKMDSQVEAALAHIARAQLSGRDGRETQ